MAKVISLPEKAFKCKGQEIVGGHRFVDGELRVSDDTAKLISHKLVTFYGCTVEDLEVEESEDGDADDAPSLSASETQGSQD